mmetsp:Transcript_102007/g.327291  ORF Transcript_102007/g.327291 Transcript_102007/m.327291 type:complete len:202 (+) Transcript_102007:102-707(+)
MGYVRTSGGRSPPKFQKTASTDISLPASPVGVAATARPRPRAAALPAANARDIGKGDGTSPLPRPWAPALPSPEPLLPPAPPPLLLLASRVAAVPAPVRPPSTSSRPQSASSCFTQPSLLFRRSKMSTCDASSSRTATNFAVRGQTQTSSTALCVVVVLVVWSCRLHASPGSAGICRVRQDASKPQINPPLPELMPRISNN